MAVESGTKGNDRFRLLADLMPQLVWTTEPDGKANYFNKQWLSYTGRSEEELIDAWQDAIHPFDLPDLLDRWGRTVLEPSDYENEFRIRCGADGSYRWYLTRASPLRNERDEIIQWIGTCTDIDDQVSTRYKLEEQVAERTAEISRGREELKTVIDGATHVSIIATTPEGLITLFNSGASNLLGYAAEEIVGKHTPALFHLASEVAARGVELTAEMGREVNGFDVFTEKTRKGQHEEREWTYVRKDGRHLTVDLVATGLRDATGSLVGFLGVALDLTERKSLEEAARSSNEHFRLIVETIEDYTLIMLGPQGHVVSWNIGAERNKGYTANEIVGKHFSCFYTPEDIERGHPDAELRIAAREGRYSEEGWRVKKDGSRFFAEIVIAAIHDEAGRLRGFAKVVHDITERRRADAERQIQEEALRKSEDLLERTGRLAGVGGWEVDLLTSTVTWSPETYRILGETLSYRPTLEKALDFYTPESRSILAAAIARSYSEGSGWDLELSLVTSDGQSLWAHVVGEVEFLNGKPIRLRGALQDITARVKEHQALQNANLRLALAAESGGIGIWDWNILTNKIVWDDGMYQLYGQEPLGGDLVAYEIWQERIHPEDRIAVEQALQDGVSGIRPYDLDFRIIWQNGALHHIHATGRVIRNADGHAVRMVGTNTDITARRNAEEALLLTERRLRDQALILDLAEDTVFIRDSEDRITYWNQGAQRLYGWSKEEALGEVTHNLLKTQFLQPHSEIEAQLFSQGHWNGELIHTRRDGSLITVASSWTTRYDETNRVASVLEINQNITMRKAIEKQLESNRLAIEEGSLRLKAVNKELEEFAYVASHDLKAPLRVIDNASKWLEEDLAEYLTAETRETMTLLRGRVKRMEKLLDDLLEYARIGRAPDKAPRETVAGDVLVNDVLALLPTSSVTVAVSPLFTTIKVSRMPLQNVLSNLIGNAIKHHDKPQGHIELTLNDAGDFYELAVQDDGPGIPAQFHDQIFKMFQTLRPRDQVEGSGMGLAMARKTVELYGGMLSVESVAGEGSTFRFTWPKEHPTMRKDGFSEVIVNA